jgi:asparagine synthase (glutamine-hydrolysing)
MELLAARLEKLRRIEQGFPRWILKLAGRVVPGSLGRSLGFLAQGWSNYLRARSPYISATWGEEEKAALWNGSFSPSSTDQRIRSWYERGASTHPMDQLQETYCREWLVEDLLMKADKMTMAASLELRCPFLDHLLVEWAERLPLEWKVGSERVGWQSKKILRHFARTRLPAEILTRQKQGFPVPAYRWLKTGLGPWAQDRLLGPGSRIGDIFASREAVNPLIGRAGAGDVAAARKVWSLLILESWLRRWM